MNAGNYRHRIGIYRTETVQDEQGYQREKTTLVLECYAQIKTFRGSTLVKWGTDFEKATTAFIIRRPVTSIDRKCFIVYRGKTYTIEYLNDNDEAIVEMQCKEIEH